MKRNDKDPNTDVYDNFLGKAKKQLESDTSLTKNTMDKTIQIAKYKAKVNSILIMLAILLLIVPVSILISYGYYASQDQANRLIQTSSQLLYVTDPNIELTGKIQTRIQFFSMEEQLNTVRRVGKQDMNDKSIKIQYTFNQVSAMEVTAKKDTPVSERIHSPFVFPGKQPDFDVNKQWSRLANMPEGTVAEIYVSLDDVYSPAQVESQLSDDIHADTRWLAVRSGTEEQSAETASMPVGYPLQGDDHMYSAFHTQTVNKIGREQHFLNVIHELAQQQKVVSSFPYYQNMSFVQLQDYLQKNGIQVYGAVVTGPVKELLKLQNNKTVRAMKVGEVALWNWE